MYIGQNGNSMLLTFVIGELQIVVHGGHKLFNDETPHDRCQVTFTLHFPVKDLYEVVCRGTKSKLCNRLLGKFSERFKIRWWKKRLNLRSNNKRGYYKSTKLRYCS